MKRRIFLSLVLFGFMIILLVSLQLRIASAQETTYIYSATYGFEDDVAGEEGTSINFINRYETAHSEAYARIVENENGHHKVLKLFDAADSNNDNFYAYHDFSSKIPYGSIEFWVLNKEYMGDQMGIYYTFGNTSGSVYISWDTFNALFILIIDRDNDGLIRLETGSGEYTWPSIYSDNNWHHIRIDFESTLGGYLGLEQYRLNFWFDGVQLLSNDPLRINDSLGMIATHSHGWDNTRHDYLDAVGFSWDPNYNLGDNWNVIEVPPFNPIFIIVLVITITLIVSVIIFALIIYRKNKSKESQIIREKPFPTIELEKDEIICPNCGEISISISKFCPNCGKEIKKEPRKLNYSSKTYAGFILTIIGGLSSIALSFLMDFLYPSVSLVLGELLIILQGFMIAGGIITLIGTVIVPVNIKVSIPLIFIGAFVAGINLLTIIGGSMIIRSIES